MDRIWKMSLMIVGIIILDQVTKGVVQHNIPYGGHITVIPGFFNFSHVHNPGAAFGMGAYGGDGVRLVFFKIIPVLACIWLMVLIWKERARSLLLCTAYSLVLAGAVGNLIDRITLDYVVDFLDFYIGRSHFPSFNVADSAISIAAGLLIIDFIQGFRKVGSEKDSDVANGQESKES
ncbi:MAG: signal peptidase II [Bacteriovoracaceae bacterium]|nr:signal peptidase II [Bacteriovoracaceae bacterium]